METPPSDPRENGPTDIAIVPEALQVDDGDEATPQSRVMREIVGAKIDLTSLDEFYKMTPKELKLSTLERFHTRRDKNALSLLASRHNVVVDEAFTLKMGAGQIRMDTTSSKIDYHLTVGNCLGLSPLLPNARSDPRFTFEMDVKGNIREFKGKHAMLGFDLAGRMLYIGKCRGEDVFLAMAPNEFLEGHYQPTRAGYSTGKSQMTRRHY
jgi:hypothetical protein